MSASRWKLWHKAVATAVIVSPGILGIGTAASAAPLPAATVVTDAGPTNGKLPDPGALSSAGDPSRGAGVASAERQAEQRGRLSTFLNALKKIPALFNAVVQGAKNGWNWFAKNVWPRVTATLGAITNLVTAWEIWQYFS